jgi:predicted dehydrogenase
MSEVNRRTFLAGATAATVALATRSSARAASANDTVNIAVMGTHNRGAQLIAGLIKLPGVNITHICDCDDQWMKKGIGAATADGAAAPQGVKDFRKALDDNSVDVFVVAAPNHWHAPATILGLEAGKHVYCEKPVSHTPDEGERMIAAAKNSKQVLQVGLQRRSNPHYNQAIEEIKNGKIGRVLYAMSTYNNRRPTIGHAKPTAPPASLDYDLWQGPALAEPYRENVLPYNWHNFWRWGNGELGNNGPHTLDICRWALGADYPTKVTASGSKLRFDDDQETPDSYTVIWEFGDRRMVWESLSWSPAYNNHDGIWIELRGDKGILALDDHGYKIYDPMRKVVKEEKGKKTQEQHLENFLSAIRSGTPVNCPIEEGHKSTMLCHLGNISYRTGQTIEVDPTTGHLKNCPSGEAYWAGEYRKGWFPGV